MSSTPTRSISLTETLEAYVKAQVASGRYSSASEVVRTGLRLLMEQEEAKRPPSRARLFKGVPA